MPQFSNKDMVAVKARSVRREGDSFIFALTYMAQEEPAPPETLKAFSDIEKIPLVIETNANAHHTVWGSTNVNPRGLELLMYCASANLYFCNVGNKPTFRTKISKVLDLTPTNRDWHVSDVPSFSDHMYTGLQYKVVPKNKNDQEH